MLEWNPQHQPLQQSQTADILQFSFNLKMERTRDVKDDRRQDKPV